jgi:predicted transcriptional regulator
VVNSALKQRVLEAVEQLPTEATIEDIIERLIFLAKIERGLADAEAGRLIPHDQVVAEFKK